MEGFGAYCAVRGASPRQRRTMKLQGRTARRSGEEDFSYGKLSVIYGREARRQRWTVRPYGNLEKS